MEWVGGACSGLLGTWWSVSASGGKHGRPGRAYPGMVRVASVGGKGRGCVLGAVAVCTPGWRLVAALLVDMFLPLADDSCASVLQQVLSGLAVGEWGERNVEGGWLRIECYRWDCTKWGMCQPIAEDPHW